MTTPQTESKIKSRYSQSENESEEQNIRLEVFLARAGIASRRLSGKIIRESRVTVNGAIQTISGTRINPVKDSVKVDGKLIGKDIRKVYAMLYKPSGYMTSRTDDKGRPVVFDLLKRIRTLVQPVGRLDCDTEGLLLLTNDGSLAYRLCRPEYKIEKSYLAKVKGIPNASTLGRLARGVDIGDCITRPAKVRLIRKSKKNSWLRIILTEGKNRQVRRMCEAVGHPVLKLIRDRYGPLKIGELKLGQMRFLNEDEIHKLKEVVS